MTKNLGPADNTPAPPVNPRTRNFLDSILAGLVSGALVAVAVSSFGELSAAMQDGRMNWLSWLSISIFGAIVAVYGLAVHKMWGRDDQYRSVVVLSVVAVIAALFAVVMFLMSVTLGVTV